MPLGVGAGGPPPAPPAARSVRGRRPVVVPTLEHPTGWAASEPRRGDPVDRRIGLRGSDVGAVVDGGGRRRRRGERAGGGQPSSHEASGHAGYAIARSPSSSVPQPPSHVAGSSRPSRNAPGVPVANGARMVANRSRSRERSSSRAGRGPAASKSASARCSVRSTAPRPAGPFVPFFACATAVLDRPRGRADLNEGKKREGLLRAFLPPRGR